MQKSTARNSTRRWQRRGRRLTRKCGPATRICSGTGLPIGLHPRADQMAGSPVEALLLLAGAEPSRADGLDVEVFERGESEGAQFRGQLRGIKEQAERLAGGGSAGWQRGGR